MALKLLFWKKTENPIQTQEISQPIIVGCKCGSGKSYEDCHELEFALPVGERPDPD